MVEYAELLEEGAGVARDHAKAAKLLAKADSPQFAVDQNNSGIALHNAKGYHK
jgi:TPR repeat protein